MSNTKRCIVAAAGFLWCLCAIVPAVRGEDGPWQTDFEAAKATAKAENKILLVDFTGSDWCPWCIKLHEEVFEKDLFKDNAPRHFVLVELDYPHEKKLPKELKSQNDMLAKKYKVHGFPTVLLMDADGQVIAHTGYQPGGPENYAHQLGGFLKAYASVVTLKGELAKATGLDREILDQLVDAYLNKLHNEIDQLTDWSREIVKLDPEDKTGLRGKHEFRVCMADCDKLMEDQKLSEAKAVLDKALAIKGIDQEAKHNANMRLEKLKPVVDAQEEIAKMKEKLDGSEGLDRAKLLDELIEAQVKAMKTSSGKKADPEVTKELQAWAREIVKLEKDNKDGLKMKYTFQLKMMDASTQAQAGAYAKARATLDQAAKLRGISDEQKAAIEQFRSQLPAGNAKGKTAKQRG